MKKWWIVIKAEIIKQQRQEYHSYFVYFSLLIWPVLGFFEVYYTYKPFLGTDYAGMRNGAELLSFLGTGFMAYTCFWTMVQNAWSMSEMERRGGTLEMSFLSPANRLALNYGKALGALMQEAWMFCCFCVFILFYTKTISFKNLFLLPVIFVLLIVSSTIWGGMLNAVFMFSRDSSIVMNILDTPMNLFSGTKIPISCFPIWAKVISLVFPLTYCIYIIRITLNIQKTDVGWIESLTGLGICLSVMIMITIWITKKAEKHNRETGEIQFY